MKMTMKKLVALTLALCMIVAVIPAGLAADLDYTGEEYHLYFGRPDKGGLADTSEGGCYFDITGIDDFTQVDPRDYGDGSATAWTHTSARWRFYTTNMSKFQFGAYNNGLRTSGERDSTGTGDGYLAIAAKLPAAGKYTLQLNFMAGMDATTMAQKVAVYMFPGDESTTAADAQAYVNEMMSADTLLGVVDSSDAGTNNVKSFAKFDVDEEMAGTEVVIVIKALVAQKVSSGWGKGQIFLESLVFNGKSDAAAIGYTAADLSATANITTTTSSGYYADAKDAAVKEGVIAFNAFYNEYTYADSYGMYVYAAGYEDAQVELISANNANLATEIGKFYALVSAIDAANFEDTVVAIPFANFDGIVYYGEPAIASVDADNWLGAKA